MKKITTLTFILLFTLGVKAQNSISFYNLGNATFQSTRLNPAFFPDAKGFFGLPAFSGIYINVNSSMGYSDAITLEGKTPIIDLDKIKESAKSNNAVALNAEIDLLHLGFRVNNGDIAIGLSARDRVSGALLLKREFIEGLHSFYTEGNKPQDGKDKTFQIGGVGAKFNYFREFTLGVGIKNKIENLTLGANFKLLAGMANLKTSSNSTADLTFKQEFYQAEMKIQDFLVNSSGIGLAQKLAEGNLDVISHFIFNKNVGFAVDLGATYQLMPELLLSASVLDLGGISWKEDALEMSIKDQTIGFEGLENLRDKKIDFSAITDKLQDDIKPDSVQGVGYSTPLAPRFFINAKSTHLKYFEAYATIGGKFAKRDNRMIYSLGIGKSVINDRLKASLNVVKAPQQPLALGAAISFTIASMQMHIAADNITNFDLTKTKGVDVRLGMSFAMGWNKAGGKKSKKSKSENIESDSSMLD